jgi:hypothetical protein
LAWNEATETDCGYWSQYDSLEDAVCNHSAMEIYTARPRLLGKFKMVNKPVRIKARKKVKK